MHESTHAPTRDRLSDLELSSARRSRAWTGEEMCSNLKLSTVLAQTLPSSVAHSQS